MFAKTRKRVRGWRGNRKAGSGLVSSGCEDKRSIVQELATE